MRIPSVSTHHPHRRFRLRRACKGVDHELAVMRETCLRLDSADGGGKANARPGGRVLPVGPRGGKKFCALLLRDDAKKAMAVAATTITIRQTSPSTEKARILPTRMTHYSLEDARQKQLPMCRHEIPGIVSPGGENPDDRKINSRRKPTTKTSSPTQITRFVTPSSDRLQTLVLPAPGTPEPPRRVAKGKRRTE
jgi:hypothetical protein